MTEGEEGRRKLRQFVGMALLLLAVSPPSQAGDVYVCKGAHGEKVFQSAPCAKVSQQLGHSTYSDSLARPSTLADYSHQAEGTVSVPDKPAGMASPPASALSPLAQHGIGAPVDHDGDVTLRCTSATGHVYYTHGKCGTSQVKVGSEERDWHADTVAGSPGATMISPNEAVSSTGQLIPLQHKDNDEPIYRRVKDSGVSADPDEACKQARLAMVRDHSKAASDHETEMCSH